MSDANIFRFGSIRKISVWNGLYEHNNNRRLRSFSWAKMPPGIRPPNGGRSDVIVCHQPLFSTSFILYLCDVTHLVTVSGSGFIAHCGLPATKLSLRDLYLQHRFMAGRRIGSKFLIESFSKYQLQMDSKAKMHLAFSR